MVKKKKMEVVLVRM